MVRAARIWASCKLPEVLTGRDGDPEQRVDLYVVDVQQHLRMCDHDDKMQHRGTDFGPDLSELGSNNQSGEPDRGLVDDG
jgi:hypothetical protein